MCMPESLAEELQLILQKFNNSEVSHKFRSRISEGALTRDENKETHFCVYFAAFDPAIQEVFTGLHLKSGLYLFNGGHLDNGELAREGATREIWEEWGYKLSEELLRQPQLLTLAYMDSPHYSCKTHYDLWYFLAVDKNSFNPDSEKLATEYRDIGWLDIPKARSLTTDPGNLEALDFIKHQLIPNRPNLINFS